MPLARQEPFRAIRQNCLLTIQSRIMDFIMLWKRMINIDYIYIDGSRIDRKGEMMRVLNEEIKKYVFNTKTKVERQ